MNLKLITIDRLREFLNKFSKVAISGKYSDLSGVPTKVSQFTNDAGYAKVTDIPTVTTYTAGEGIDITNGVISIKDQVLNTRTDSITYTAPGYTLYGNYFLSNTIITNKNWNEACAMTANVTITKTITTTTTYLVSGEKTSSSISTKIATTKTLSKAELETIPREQREISENGHVWYWTSTPYDDRHALYVSSSGYFCHDRIIDDSVYNGGARLGFKNPFI